jgi:hypothetical protein
VSESDVSSTKGDWFCYFLIIHKIS